MTPDKPITIHLFYTGKNGNAKRFMEDMNALGIADRVRAEEGNLRYEYYIPADDPETVLLIDCWKNQAALDTHHSLPIMQEIMYLRDKYQLSAHAEKFLAL